MVKRIRRLAVQRHLVVSVVPGNNRGQVRHDSAREGSRRDDRTLLLRDEAGLPALTGPKR